MFLNGNRTKPLRRFLETFLKTQKIGKLANGLSCRFFCRDRELLLVKLSKILSHYKSCNSFLTLLGKMKQNKYAGLKSKINTIFRIKCKKFFQALAVQKKTNLKNRDGIASQWLY